MTAALKQLISTNLRMAATSGQKMELSAATLSEAPPGTHPADAGTCFVPGRLPAVVALGDVSVKTLLPARGDELVRWQ
jgi:hypothetical protein